jgi:hypothetical protein
MAKVFHLELKSSNLHKYYGDLTILCKQNTDIGISKFTLDRHNFEVPYENNICIIRKAEIVKSARTVSNGA